jgi:hypothetical protein
MTRLCCGLDRLQKLGYFYGGRLKVDKRIDKVPVFVYNECRKYAITGVRYGEHNNGS